MLLRIFSLIILLFIVNIFFFHSYFLKKIIINSLDNITEKKISIKKIDLSFKKNILILNNIKIYNPNNFAYEHFFICKKITIKPVLNSLFKNVIEFENLTFYEPIIFLEIQKQSSNKKDLENIDNIDQVEKSSSSYKPKIYPIKKKDINIFIKKVITHQPKANLKYANSYKVENLILSEMEINNVGNTKENSQHFKDVFKLILLDFYFRIPNFEIKKELKKIYKL